MTWSNSVNLRGSLDKHSQGLTAQDRRLLDEALGKADDVIVFGSRAARVHSRTSDLDLLCVGDRVHRYKSERLDIVARTTAEITDQKWLGSELANHVVAYGVTVVGSSKWRDSVKLAESALTHKERRLMSLIDGIWAYWDRLHPDYRRKYLTTIRREGQRLGMLNEGIAVPPTPVLDKYWKTEFGVSEKWASGIERVKTDNPATRERLLRTADLLVRQSFQRGASENQSSLELNPGGTPDSFRRTARIGKN